MSAILTFAGRSDAGFDEQVEAFRERPLEGEYPYLWLDAKHVKARSGGHVRSKALVIAVHETGRREVLGLDVGEVESGAFWVEFLRSLPARGLTPSCRGRWRKALEKGLAEFYEGGTMSALRRPSTPYTEPLRTARSTPRPPGGRRRS